MTARPWLLTICALVLACAQKDPKSEAVALPSKSGEGVVDRVTDGAAKSGSTAPIEVGPAPQLLIIDPTTLIALEQGGLGLAELLHGGAATATADYGPGPLQAITASLATRLARDHRDDTRAGAGFRYVHRQFDIEWLAAPDTRFELIGVVNRMDREVFAPDSFGETRLIYRLAYTRAQRDVTIDSRLPMTINVVYRQRGEDRRAVQRRWAAEPELEGAALASWLVSDGHALDPALLGPELLEAVEIDVQTERWPSTIRPDMAGHAEYLLEVFHRMPDATWAAAPLENTPDVARLRRDSDDRAALLEWLRSPDQRAALDNGTLVVPERFLAKAATSITPRGFARVGNRPWSQLYSPEDFADLELADATSIGSPAALLRRLDGLTCQGCHESRSIAGFHLLGVERDPNKAVDGLAVASSPHLEGELERRRGWHDAVQRGQHPSEARPLSDYERNRGAWGTHCGLGDPGFATWTCDPGLVCATLSDPELGTCLEPGPGVAGGVCEVGRVESRTNPDKDRVTKIEQLACASGGVCNDNGVGFPEGMCAFWCDATEAGPNSACGAIPNLRSFNDCLAAKKPFATCIADTSNPAGMRACSSEAPCRDDYICARSSSEAGVCLPPYFLFQLRVDGHPA